MWGRLLTCGRLPIGLPGDANKLRSVFDGAASTRSSAALVSKVDCLRPRRISCFNAHNSESGILNQLRDRAVQMTAAGEPFPQRRKPLLPPPHSLLPREPVLDKQQLSTRLEDAPDLPKCFPDIGNRA